MDKSWEGHRIVRELITDSQERGGIDIREVFIDGSFALEKKGRAIGWTKHGKWSQIIIAITDGSDLPVAACLASALLYEVKFAE